MSIINIGAADNDGTGDPLRDAGRKMNRLFGGALSRTVDGPAAVATLDNLYIVPESATGDFAGQDNNLAYRAASAWEFYTPPEGFTTWVNDDNETVVFNGSAWEVFSGGGSGGVGGSPFQGASVRRDTNQSIPSNSNTTVIWESEIYDEGAWWDAGSPTRLTVPAGVTRVRVAGNAARANQTDQFLLVLLKNGDVFPGAFITDTDTSGGDFVNGASGVLEVVPGDYFELRVFMTGAADLDAAAGLTWLSIEEVPAIQGGSAFEYVEDTSTTRTLDASDFSGDRTLEMTNAAAITLTLNTGIVAAGPLRVIQGGAGTVAVAGTATVQAKGAATGSNGQESSFLLIPTDTLDTYKMIGDIA